ncbi:MAG: hypothetical protein QXI59_02010 [Candidatus Bathyarchaeia archaeon]
MNKIVLISAEIRSESDGLIVELKKHLSVCDLFTIATAKEGLQLFQVMKTFKRCLRESIKIKR